MSKEQMGIANRNTLSSTQIRTSDSQADHALAAFRSPGYARP